MSDTLPPDPNGVAMIASSTADILSGHDDVHLIGPDGCSPAAGVEYTGMPRLPIGTPDLHLPRPRLKLVSDAVAAADRVVVHTPGLLGLAALHYARRQRKHSTLFLHNDYPALFRYGLPRTLAAPATSWLGRRLESWSVGMATRTVAPWGTARPGFEVLHLEPPRAPFASPSENYGGDVTISYHGRVSREKAVDAIVRAIHAADRQDRRMRLRIIGEGSQLPSTLRLAASLGVRVEHVPWCADPVEALRGTHIYVTASRTETFSMTTLEAIGCGLPLIARGVGQIPTYVRHDVNGLLFDLDDELPALLRTLADDPAARIRLAAEARASATDRTLWDQFAEASIGMQMVR